MSSITTSSGLFSGIPTQEIIDAIITQYSRPQQLAQQRLLELQVRQAAVLEINSLTQTLRSSSATFRTQRSFDQRRTATSDEAVATAVASTGAQRGSFKFTVDRLVSTQQRLTRGFADTDTTAVGATRFTFEREEARLDRDTPLSELNDGAGVERGTIEISVGLASATVDLSRTATLGEAIEAINSSLQSVGIELKATARDGGIAFTKSGINEYDRIRIQNTDGRATAEDLGIATDPNVDSGFALTSGGYTAFTGANVHGLSRATSVFSLNDGNGIDLPDNDSIAAGLNSRPDFNITVAGTTVGVQLGPQLVDGESEKGVTTLGGVLDRINQALQSKAETSSITAQVADDGVSIELINEDIGETISISEVTGRGQTTARDLGLLGGTFDAATSVFSGERIFSGPNQTLLKNLAGGGGLTGRNLTITTDSGTVAIDFDDIYANPTNPTRAQTVQDLIAAINTAAEANAPFDSLGDPLPAEFRAELDDLGTGLRIVNTTGSSVFTIAGDAAAELGLTAAVADGVVSGGNLQHRYFSEGTRLGSLNGGTGIGQGTIRVTDSFARSASFQIGEGIETVGQLIREIKSAGLRLDVRVNDNGDGLLFAEPDGVSGGEKIRVEDVSGQVALNLGIRKSAEGTGDDNFVDGSFERVVEFDATDTLEQIVDKINEVDTGVSAAIINDGSGGSPNRITFTSLRSGSNGRIIIDTGDTDLRMRTLDEGRNARIFYGTEDPASSLLIQSSTNELSGVVRGVSIQLSSTSDEPVEITVSDDVDAMEEDTKEFVDAFNALVEKIDFHSRYLPDANDRGVLLGDGTMLSLRSSLFSSVSSNIRGFSQVVDNLADVGITIGGEGVLKFDSAAFRSAYENDPDGVKALFTKRDIVRQPADVRITDGFSVSADPDAPQTFTALGVVPIIENLAQTYVTSLSGVLTLKRQTLDDQILLQEDRIASLQQGLDRRRATLEQQYLAMERSIAQLQNQQASLSQVTRLG